jgi:hypothetical protein
MFHPVPTLIRGVLYPSQKAAAAALGVHYTTVQKAVDAGTQDRVGMSPRGRRIALPVEIDGVQYPSRRAAAIKLGVSKERIAMMMKAE